MTKRTAYLALFALALAGTACSQTENPAAAQSPAAGASAPTQPVAVAAGPTQTLPDFAAIVEANKGAVVNITSTKNAPAQMQLPFGGGQNGQGDEEGDDNPLNEFLRRFQGQIPRMPQQGMGSGFIVQADGVVLTNAHVVEGADEVRVKLSDQREFKGRVAGVDKLTDVAVVKIDATGLPTVKFGDPSKIRVGEWVLAIGSPFGFESTVTAGIVSGTSRSLPEGTYVPFIQTDAAVNPGNSGGPLFNLRGEVIGMNSAIYSRTGGYMGVAFAIPIDVAAGVEEQLLKTGKVERGRIGVGIQEVTSSLAQSFGLDRPRGALVSTVEAGGPAEKAGLKPGDVLLSFEGKPIERSNQLPPMVANVKPGTQATMEVWRGGRKEALKVTVAELKTDQTAKAKPQSEEHGQLGLAVRPLSPEERKELDGTQGLVVQQASGPAARAGIRPGDLITAVNGAPVKTVDDLRKLVSKAKGTVALLVRRGDASIFVPIEIG